MESKDGSVGSTAAYKAQELKEKLIMTSADQERLRQQFEFIAEIDKEKKIMRQTPLSDNSRMEDDAEHAWHMALMVLLLSEYSNEKIDVLRTLSMVLIHDLIEIYAGDTYAYDEEGKKDQHKRELEAADRLYSILPDDQRDRMRALWDEFEAEETPEARFARTMDNIQPLVLNNASNGSSWVKHGICVDQVLGRNKNTAKGSNVLWQYAYENYIEPAVEKGLLKGHEEH